jgi:hypothetical protein
MNQKANEFFSKVEKYYDVKLKRVTKVSYLWTVRDNQLKNNPLVMEHRVADAKGVVYHRWSYSTGRKVEIQLTETNVL